MKRARMPRIALVDAAIRGIGVRRLLLHGARADRSLRRGLEHGEGLCTENGPAIAKPQTPPLAESWFLSEQEDSSPEAHP
jgi:hypothetical protein